jgi:hypothetical protein
MPIDFDRMPTENPTSALIPPGFYKAVVKDAKMGVAKSSGNPQLTVRFDLFDILGRKAGTLFDRFQESDKPLLMFKLNRFVMGLGLTFKGSVELKDIGKVAIGRQCALEIEHQQDSRFKDDPSKKQAAVRVFGSDAYWPISEFAELAKMNPETPPAAPAGAAQAEEEDEPFNPPSEEIDAADAEDAPSAPAGNASDY